MMLIQLLTIFIGASFATEKNDGCNTGNASCNVGNSSTPSTCVQYLLPWLCRIGHACCHQKDTIQASNSIIEKRVCVSTSKKCQRLGGTCENTDGIKASCQTMTFPQICNSRSCECCIGDNIACDTTPKCRFRGGYCYRGKRKKLCPTKNSLKSGCRGKKCSCCLADRGCSCGIALQTDRVVGGQIVKPPHKYPWIVGIQVPEDLNGTYVCGGSIINENYILTAAHCMFSSFGPKRRPKDLKVGIADYNQYSTSDDIPGVTALVDVKKIITHENYKGASTGDDIALLHLKEPLNLISYPQLKPVCLPTVKKQTYENATGIVYGWGTTRNSNVPPPILRETTVPILDPTCENKIIGGVKILPQMLCAGYPQGGKDTCAGDSGGPLTVEENGINTIVGITSFGVGCGLKNLPGVYTRVTSYVKWIIENTRDSTYCN